MQFHSQRQAIRQSQQANAGQIYTHSSENNLKTSSLEVDDLAANFQHTMVIQDHYEIKTKVKYYGAQVEQSECVTPEKTKSMLIQPFAIVNTKPKKKVQEEERFQTPPRRPQKLTLEELDFMMRQQRVLDRKMYDFKFN